MVALPLALPVTVPLELTVATVVLLLLQDTVAPEARSFTDRVLVFFTPMDRLPLLREGDLTVTSHLSSVPLTEAVMVAVPAATAVILPLLSTEATVVLLLFQVTEAPEGTLVTARVSEPFRGRVREALLRAVAPVASETVTSQAADFFCPSTSMEAVMVAVPLATAVTLPPLTAAILSSLEVQETAWPSGTVAAARVLDSPTIRLSLVGATVMLAAGISWAETLTSQVAS